MLKPTSSSTTQPTWRLPVNSLHEDGTGYCGRLLERLTGCVRLASALALLAWAAALDAAAEALAWAVALAVVGVGIGVVDSDASVSAVDAAGRSGRPKPRYAPASVPTTSRKTPTTRKVWLGLRWLG